MGFSFKEIGCEESKKGIEKVLRDIKINMGVSPGKIKKAIILEFDGKLPKFFLEEVDKAARYVIDTYLDNFKEVEGHYFILGRPYFNPRIDACKPIYGLQLKDSVIYSRQTTVMATTVYQRSQIFHKEPFKEHMEKFRAKEKDKFIYAVLDKDGIFNPDEVSFSLKGNFVSSFVLKADKEMEILAFVTPESNEALLLDKLAYAAMHEAVHLLTMPEIINKGFSRYPEKSFEQICEIESLDYASELTAYSLGTFFFNQFHKEKGRQFDWKPSDYSIDIPVIKEADGIIASSESLDECIRLLGKRLR